MKKNNNKSRQDILNFIQQYTTENGYSPSFRDIASGCGISSTSVFPYHLDILQEQGLITRKGDLSRTVKVVED